MTKAQIDLSATDKTKAAFDSAKKNLQGLNEQARALPASFGSIGVAIAAAVSINSLKGIIDGADELSKLSQKTGIAVESLSELKYAGSLADVSIESIAKGVKTLSTNMLDAATGSKEAAESFTLVGVSIKSANGALRGADDVLADVADTFKTMDDGPEKAALAVKLFGKAGMDMIPMLNDGKEGLEAMRLEARQLGAVISTETAKAAEEFNDNLTRLNALSNAAGKDIAAGLLPTLVELTDAFVESRKEAGGFTMIADGLRTAFETVVVLGANVAYVIKGIGIEIGGLAAQAAAIARLDFSGAAEIGRAMKSDALDNRRKVDDFGSRVMNAREAKRLEASFGGGMGDGSIGRSSGKKSTLGLKDAAGADSAAKAANKELQAQAKLLAELSGLSGSFAEDWSRLNAIYAKGAISLKQLTEQQAILLAKQPAIKAAAEAEEKLGQLRVKTAELSDKYLSTLITENDQLVKSNQTLFEEVEAIGLNAEALNMLRLARLDANIAREQELLLVSQGVEGNEAEAAQIERRINLLRRERDLKAEEGAKEIRAGEIEDNKKRTEGISQSISDGLLDGFRNGKSLADIFLTELKAQFSKTVLQPLITPIVQAGNDALGGALKGGAGGGGGFWGSALSSLFGGGATAAFSGTSLGASGFGSGLAYGNMDLGANLMSLDGGGYTGNGLRTGGMDGKGGFMAMLHPQETVVDHTKGQKVGGSSTVVNNYTFGSGVRRSEVVAGIQQALAQARTDRVEDGRRRRN